MASTVLVIKQSSLKFVLSSTVVPPATEPDFTTAPDFTCQVTSGSINANANLQTVPATWCGAESQAPAATGWELALTVLQDWGATDSISDFLFDHDAERAFFQITPTDPEIPGMEGECWLVAGSYLGDAGTPLTADIGPLPLLAKPTRIPVVVAAEAGAESTSTSSSSSADEYANA